MNRKTILLVEDNPDEVELARHAFRKSGGLAQLIAVGSGVEALDYLFGQGAHAGRDRTDQPAVVLLDLKLPKLGGLEVLQRMRADPRTKCVPVVVLTSSRETQDLWSSYAAGANSYVRKPVDFDQFAAAVLLIAQYWLTLNEPPSGEKPTAESDEQ